MEAEEEEEEEAEEMWQLGEKVFVVDVSLKELLKCIYLGFVSSTKQWEIIQSDSSEKTIVANAQ